MATMTSATTKNAQIDQLVARYAPLGARRKRRRRLRRASAAAGLMAGVAMAGWVYSVDVTMPDGFRLTAAESERIGAERAALDRDRVAFAAKLAELEQQIAAGQSALELRRDHGSQLDREIAAIAAQRKTLEERWGQFEAQGKRLATEIVAVSAQRKELEAQRRQIDRQQAQLAELLDRIDSTYRRIARDAETAARVQPIPEPAEQTSIVAAAGSPVVGQGNLDDMRGGFTIGDKLDISFGFSQTGSINGVQQYTNHFTIDSMASDFTDVDFSNASTYVLQNGAGNFISGNVLDMAADTFGSIIQNTLDDQVISTTTTYDIGLHNMPGTLQGMQGEQALLDSLTGY